MQGTRTWRKRDEELGGDRRKVKEWMRVNRREQRKEGREGRGERQDYYSHRGRAVARLLEKLGRRLSSKRHSCEITMQFKSIPNLLSYY